MLAFILRRLLQSLLVMTVVAYIAFALFNYVGDPVAFMLGQDATMQDRQRLRAELGLDQPFYVQFTKFLGNAVQGDFGVSLRQGRQVAVLLKERLPATLELSFAAALIALFVGIPLGVYTALRRQHVALAFPARRLAGRREPADVPDRHPPDPDLRRVSGLAAVVRARRRRAARLVDHGPADDERA